MLKGEQLRFKAGWGRGGGERERVGGGGEWGEASAGGRAAQTFPFFCYH